MSKLKSVNRIHPEELDQLSNIELTERMDNILKTFHHETIPEPLWDTIPMPLVSDLLNTHKVKNLNDKVKRKALYKTFDYLLQMMFFNRCAAASNHMVYDSNHYKKSEWRSVSVQITNAAIRQWIIVSSRIAFEKFMDLIYFIEQGEEIKARTSKFNRFKSVIFNPKELIAYFSPHMARVRMFDKNYRTPEVHGGSNYPRKILLMEQPTSGDLNGPMGLGNDLMNVWNALIEILNNKKPTHISGEAAASDWLKTYLSNDLDKISRAIERYEGECKE